MKWYETTVKTNKEDIELVSNILIECGANGTVISDPVEVEQLIKELNVVEYADEGLIPKDGFFVTAYFSIDEDINHLKDKLNNGLSTLVNTLNIIEVDDEEWKNNWKKYYQPFYISKHIRIIPIWEKENIKNSKYDVYLDPGMAFGTGTHETTRMCSRLLEKYLTPQMNVIDVGCGSGILSIISKKLAAKEVVAIDIDKSAIKATKENALLNNIDDIKIIQGELKSYVNKNNADIIVANIVSDIIIALLDSFKDYLATNGKIICSGIIKPREEDVKKAILENGYSIEEIIYDNEWVAIVINA